MVSIIIPETTLFFCSENGPHLLLWLVNSHIVHTWYKPSWTSQLPQGWPATYVIQFISCSLRLISGQWLLIIYFLLYFLHVSNFNFLGITRIFFPLQCIITVRTWLLFLESSFALLSSFSKDFLNARHAPCFRLGSVGTCFGFVSTAHLCEADLAQHHSMLSEVILGFSLLLLPGLGEIKGPFLLWIFISNHWRVIRGLIHMISLQPAVRDSLSALNSIQRALCPVQWHKSTDHVCGCQSNINWLWMF